MRSMVRAGLVYMQFRLRKLAGAKQIFVIDTQEEQLSRALKLGADVAINPSKNSPIDVILRTTNGIGVEVAAEFIGINKTISQAVESVCPGGRVVVAGLGSDPISILPPTVFVRKQISLLGSYAFTQRTIEQLVSLVSAGRLNLHESITHVFPLEEVNTALKYLHEKIENPIRIVITMP